MSRRHRVPIRHRRAWYFLWIFCTCGRGWRCPRASARTHGFHPPPQRFRPATATAAARRRLNQRPTWDAPTWSHLANGRAGGLTPGQLHRTAPAARSTNPAAPLSGPAAQPVNPAAPLSGPTTQPVNPAAPLSGPTTQPVNPAAPLSGPTAQPVNPADLPAPRAGSR
ncbi:hypothetical protein [Plantactinospora sp. CA-290183]|uniref:hypothetical protein n=1 Tax=Plantactinospora sp. CA-290183 TaxID=3240006 RepID=UPI003D8C5A31